MYRTPPLMYFGNSSVFDFTYFLKIVFHLWEWKMEVSEMKIFVLRLPCHQLLLIMVD